MADTVAPVDLEPLRKLQTQGFTGGIVDHLYLEIAGFGIPGLLKGYDIPDIEFETVDTEGGLQTRIPTKNVKPVIASFITMANHPGIGALLVRSPAIKLSSKKSRMSLVSQNARYEDGVEIIGVFYKAKRARQEYKNLDTCEYEVSVHTSLHKWGDGVEDFECAYYKTQPPQLRIHMKEIVGGEEEKSLIKW